MPLLQSKYKGYPYPDPINEELTCVKIWIPAGMENLNALIANMEYLSKWTAWLKRGEMLEKHQAQQWQKALYTTLGDLSECGGNNQPMIGDIMLRQNEENPCLLEYSIDCENWITVFDASLCGDSYENPFTSPIPGINQNDASRELIALMIDISITISEAIDNGDDDPGIINILAPKVPNSDSPAIRKGLKDIIDVMRTKDLTTRTNKIADSEVWDGLHETLACEAEEDGSWLPEAAQNITDVLKNDIDWLRASMYTFFVDLPLSLAAAIGKAMLNWTSEKFDGGIPACVDGTPNGWIIRYCDFDVTGPAGSSNYIKPDAIKIPLGNMPDAYARAVMYDISVMECGGGDNFPAFSEDWGNGETSDAYNMWNNYTFDRGVTSPGLHIFKHQTYDTQIEAMFAQIGVDFASAEVYQNTISIAPSESIGGKAYGTIDLWRNGGGPTQPASRIAGRFYAFFLLE